MTRNTAQHDVLLDELLKDYTDPEDILGEHGLLQQLTKRVIERARGRADGTLRLRSACPPRARWD
jgi:hypothetical protein